MKVEQKKEFQPVVITLETEDEVQTLFSCLTRLTSGLENKHRVFMHDLSHLLSESTNVFDREQS